MNRLRELWDTIKSSNMYIMRAKDLNKHFPKDMQIIYMHMKSAINHFSLEKSNQYHNKIHHSKQGGCKMEKKKQIMPSVDKDIEK